MGLRQSCEKLVIIGLDGCDWEYLNQYRTQLPMFNQLLNHGSRLESDIRPIHSAPCWSQLFAGTTFGLTDFPKGRDAEPYWERPEWIWKGVDGAVVIGVPATLPPIWYGLEESPNQGWVATSLSLTATEMQKSTWHRSAQLAAHVRSADAHLVVIVFPALDRAGHIFGMDDKRTFAQYAEVDVQLAVHWRHMREQAWVILSDHGMTSTLTGPDWGHRAEGGESRRRGWHSPNGVLFTNLLHPPERLSEVYQWLQ